MRIVDRYNIGKIIKYKENIYTGFTLAESLVTLLIIGVAVALLLPVFINNTGDRVQSGQRKVFESKLKEGLHRMQIKGDLARDYESTEEFVSNMKNYFNIVKICPTSKLSGCFAEKIRSDADTKITKNLTNSDELGASFSNPSDIVGVVFNDGSSALVTYNTTCYVANIYDQTVDVTKCLAMYYDVNSTRWPNIVGEDIGEVNLGSAVDDDMEIELFQLSTLTSFSQSQCEQARDEYGAPIKDCGTISADYWSAAVLKCHREGKRLPTGYELYKIAKKLYDSPINYPKNITRGLNIADESLKSKLGLDSASYITIISGEELSKDEATHRIFSATETQVNDNVNGLAYGVSRSNKNYYTFCTGSSN